MELHSKQIFNIGILLNGVLIPGLFSKPLVPCSFMNLYFLNPHLRDFDCIINLPFFCFKNLWV